MSMFTPFAPSKGEKKKDDAVKKEEAPAASAGSPSELDELKMQLASMQSKIEKLSRDRS